MTKRDYIDCIMHCQGAGDYDADTALDALTLLLATGYVRTIVVDISRFTGSTGVSRARC
jgi:hypothetical protein